jgi:hypothetical protein
VKDAACAEPAGVGRILGSAPAADVVSGDAGALATHRLLMARVAHQPPGLSAPGQDPFAARARGYQVPQTGPSGQCAAGAERSRSARIAAT